MSDERDPAPHWNITTMQSSPAGIERATFTVEFWEPVEDVYAAMRKLCAAALWWLDTDPTSTYTESAEETA